MARVTAEMPSTVHSEKLGGDTQMKDNGMIIPYGKTTVYQCYHFRSISGTVLALN